MIVLIQITYSTALFWLIRSKSSLQNKEQFEKHLFIWNIKDIYEFESKLKSKG